jgi:type IV pilus assembly protein PilE
MLQTAYPTFEYGITLIEHLVAMTVTSIVMAIAVPNYSDYVRRGSITDATSTLQNHAQRLEAFYDDTGNFGAAGACAIAPPAASAQWTYACGLLANGQGFRLTATGRATLAGYAYALDDTGGRTTPAFPGTTITRPCWVIRTGDC